MGGIGAKHLKRRRAPGRQKPLPAAIRVPPPFKMNALRVVAQEQVLFELVIVRTRPKPRQVGITTGRKFGFIRIDAAARTSQEKHEKPRTKLWSE